MSSRLRHTLALTCICVGSCLAMAAWGQDGRENGAPAADEAEVEKVVGLDEYSGFELLQVDPAEEYAANCVRINDYVLIASGYSQLQSQLKELDYQTIALDMSEYEKMDGGLSCLSLRY